MINWCGYDWIQTERWGEVHPEKSHWWYDPGCSFVDEFGNLQLLSKKKSKFFPHLGVTSSVAVGLVSCKKKFSFGEFEIESKLPFGDNLWPAFWMWSWDSWPPEIDVLEGYSDINPNYFKFRLMKPLGFWNIQTNVHYIDGVNKMLGGKTHWFGFKNPTKEFIKYSVIWERNRLRFYYGGKLVRKIEDKKIMDQLSKTTMNVVINNGVTEKVDIKNPPYSSFIIKSFNYSKI